MSELFAEVHAHVGQILDDDRVVTGGQFADGLQLLLGQADPGRVVGVGVDDGCNVPRFQVTFQFRSEFLGTIFIDVERLTLDSQNLGLLALNGKSRVDEENCILFRIALRADLEEAESALHRTDGRKT